MRKSYESGCKRWCVGIFGLRRALEPKRALDLSVPSGAALASRAGAAQPERRLPLGSYAAPYHSLVASAYCVSSLSFAPHGRPHLRHCRTKGEAKCITADISVIVSYNTKTSQAIFSYL